MKKNATLTPPLISPHPPCHPSEPGQSPPSSLLLSSLTTALSELSGAGEHMIDRASGVQEQASERPLPCHCSVLKGTHCHRGQYPIPAHHSHPRRLFYKRKVIEKDEASSPTTATSHQHNALAK